MSAGNPFREKLLAGGHVTGAFVADVREPFVVQVAASAGLDFIVIDMEHGPIGLETASTLCQTARLAGVTPIVRVVASEYAIMCPLLDAGARGLMLPRIETAEQVARAAECCLYPPKGRRGAVLVKGLSDYRGIDLGPFMEQANEELVLIPQIELMAAVENLEEILAVEGVGAVLVGPGDLSVSMGIPGQWEDPREVEVIGRVVDTATRHHVPCGIALGDIESCRRWRERGMRVLCAGSDTSILLGGFKRIADELG